MLERTTANATFPKLDMFVGFGIERERIRKLKESGAPPPWTDDPILAKHRFCNVNVQDDRGSRAIFELVTKPHANDPGLIVALDRVPVHQLTRDNHGHTRLSGAVRSRALRGHHG